MKKVSLFIIIGAFAWSMQACNNARNDDRMDRTDSLDEGMAPMDDDMDTSFRDTIGQGDIDYTDTTGTTPIP